MPPPTVPGGRPAPPNPYYAGQGAGAGGGSSGFNASMEPVSYGSLKDLQKNQKQTGSKFSYKPNAERAGYHAPPPEPVYEERRMPPAPSNYGQGVPPPPRRNVPNEPSPYAASAGTTTFSSATSRLPAGAQGYANTAGSYASAGLDKIKDGFGSIATTERRDQVAGGVVKGAAGAAKLLGKGAWTLGKFAANGGKT